MPQFLGYEITTNPDDVNERNEAYDKGYIEKDVDFLLGVNILKKEKGAVVRNPNLNTYPEEITNFINWASGDKKPRCRL